MIKARAKPVPADPFSLIIGDALQNFRGCLDYLAFELASAYTKPLPEDIARESQFPIVGDINSKGIAGQGAVMFQSVRKCIRGIDPNAQAIIENAQPYKRENDFINDPLWLLACLSNVDKHRVVHLATIYPHIFDFNPRGKQTYPILTVPKVEGLTFAADTSQRVEHDTVIARIGVKRVTDPKVNVKLEIAPSVSFTDGVAIHEDILDVLQRIELHIRLNIIVPLTEHL